jgi:hypothetical protein
MRLPKQIVHTTKWADPASVRYALGGVRVGCRGGNAFAEATDGRRLVLLEWKDKAEDVDVILSSKELGTAVRAAKTKDSRFDRTNSTLAAMVNERAVHVIDGMWPKSEDLFREENIGTNTAEFTPARLREIASRVPVDIGGVTVLLNPQYLRDLADAAEAVGDGTVTMRAKDPQSQVVCERFAPGLTMTAVIMPVAAD